MSNARKLEAYRENKVFVEKLNEAFLTKPRDLIVATVEYEVYEKELDDECSHFVECLIVKFNDGTKSVMNVNYNSSIANFAALNKMIMAKYSRDSFVELSSYEILTLFGYNLIEL